MRASLPNRIAETAPSPFGANVTGGSSVRVAQGLRSCVGARRRRCEVPRPASLSGGAKLRGCVTSTWHRWKQSAVTCRDAEGGTGGGGWGPVPTRFGGPRSTCRSRGWTEIMIRTSEAGERRGAEWRHRRPRMLPSPRPFLCNKTERCCKLANPAL